MGDAALDGRRVVLNLRPRLDEQGGAMLWFVSWLVGDDGAEGEWFYSGAGERREFAVPAGATGVRIRRWPSPGMDPEYVDVALEGEREQVVSDRGLAFDRRQAHSMLAVEA